MTSAHVRRAAGAACFASRRVRSPRIATIAAAMATTASSGLVEIANPVRTPPSRGRRWTKASAALSASACARGSGPENPDQKPRLGLASSSMPAASAGQPGSAELRGEEGRGDHRRRSGDRRDDAGSVEPGDAERMHSCHEEGEEGFHGGVRIRCENVSAGPEDRRRLEVLADPPSHEQVLVAVGIEQRSMVLPEPNAERQPKSAAGGSAAAKTERLMSDSRAAVRVRRRTRLSLPFDRGRRGRG